MELDERSGVNAQEEHDLRAEVINAQQARTELLKWKLFLSAVLGAAGLGLDASSNLPKAPLVLCCIPLVCAYVDLICAHLSLRMLVIGAFLRTAKAGRDCDYERFVEKARHLGAAGEPKAGGGAGKSAYALEDWASYGASFLLSLGVAFVGVVRAVNDAQGPGLAGVLGGSWPYLISAALGVVLTLLVRHTSDVRVGLIKTLATKETAERKDRSVPAERAAAPPEPPESAPTPPRPV